MDTGKVVDSVMALKARPGDDEAQENRPRGSMNVESMVALVLQQNLELQKEVFALRQGQEANEKKKEDTACVGLTYGASLCSGLGFGSTPISTGVSLEGLIGVPMNGSGQLSGVWNGPGQVGDVAGCGWQSGAGGG